MKESQPQESKLRKSFLEIYRSLIIAVIAAIIMKVFFIEAYRIPTGSMEQTLLIGDFLLVNKFVYGSTTPRNIPFTDSRIPFIRFPALKEPHRNDVVVFDFPGNRDELESKEITMYIKRCIGEPGDTVKIVNKKVYVNNNVFPDPPLSMFDPHVEKTTIVDARIFPKGSGWNEDNYGPIRVPKKGDVINLTPDNFEAWRVFIMREGHTPVKTPDGKIMIDGKEVNSYSVVRNYYFMMGDNRNNSLDSRFWGFVPDDHLVGEALMVYWSWDPSIPFSHISSLLSSVRWNRIATIIK